MGLRERGRVVERAGRRRPDRLRAPVALVAVLAALVAFTTLARPQSSPSARLSIGDGSEDAGATPEPAAAEDRPRRVLEPEPTEALARPLDPVTLADVPATILALRPGEWLWPSEDGALVALPVFAGPDGSEVRVLAARTLQPVTTVKVERQVDQFHGFTDGADALLLIAGAGSRQTLVRQPLDPGRPATRVDLPEGVALVQGRVTSLARERVAMVVVEPSGLVRVLVADLSAERLAVDLPLPELRAELLVDGPREAASLAGPGFAWDAARERLFVVHADAAKVTVVDLAAGAVAAEAQVGTPLAELGEEPVQRWRSAQVSPDGTRLYVTGSEHRPATSTSEPFGLSVIDTATLTEVTHMSRVGDWAQLSPDGRWLLWQSGDTSRAALMATDEIGLVTLLGGDSRAAYPLGFSPDSSHVYLQRDEVGGSTVVAHALPSLERSAERHLPDDAWFDPTTGLLRQGG